MLPTMLTSFTTFLATIGPIEAAVIFATLTPQLTQRDRWRIALKATVIASIILGSGTLFGGALLRQLGVGLPALQTAGGIILLLIALDMVFARPTSSFKLTAPEGAEAQMKDDIAIFPLATPLLAGPGAISTGILMAANADGDPARLGAVMAALAAVMAITLVLLTLSQALSRVIGVTAQRVLVRVFGILLSAIAVQAVFNGVAASPLFR
jgi:multiple antibiotic resistance protein